MNFKEESAKVCFNLNKTYLNILRQPAVGFQHTFYNNRFKNYKLFGTLLGLYL